MIDNVHSVIGKGVRIAGQSLDAFGRHFEVNPVVEKLKPSTRLVKLSNHAPNVKAAFVAQSATIIGRVKIGEKSSVWYDAIVRGDDNTISIGESVTVGDRVMIHCSGHTMDAPTVIGDRVTIESGAILHGCHIGDDTMIGAGAQVMDGAKVGKNVIIEAGSLIAQNKIVPGGQMWAGAPAKYVRDLTPAEIAALSAKVSETLALAEQHQEERVKTWQTIEEEEYVYDQTIERNPFYFKRLTPEEMSYRLGEVQGHHVPGRILDSEVSGRPRAPLK